MPIGWPIATLAAAADITDDAASHFHIVHINIRHWCFIAANSFSDYSALLYYWLLLLRWWYMPAGCLLSFHYFSFIDFQLSCHYASSLILLRHWLFLAGYNTPLQAISPLITQMKLVIAGHAGWLAFFSINMAGHFPLSLLILLILAIE